MDTFRAIRRVLWVTMGLNLVATAAKLIVGYWTGSLSLIADGVDSVFDAASNVVGLVGIHFAARPADDDHPYGHRKAETMTALIIAGLLLLTTWELLQSAIERLRNPALIEAEANWWSFAALLASIIIHTIVVWYEMREGRRLGSDVLVADALHTRADIFISLSVAGGLIAVRLGYPIADPILAVVVALLIAKIGIDILRQNIPTLMDRLMIPVDQVEQVALSVPGVLSCHRVRSRGHEQDVYADLHIRVDPEMSTDQAHSIAHEVQRRLRESQPDLRDVTVHVEPSRTPQGEPGVGSDQPVASQLRKLAEELGIAVHDLWIREVDGHYHTDLHLEADGALSLQEAHRMASSLEKKAREQIPELDELTTHIEPQGRPAVLAEMDLKESQVAQIVQQVADDTLGAGACHRIQARPGLRGWAISMHCNLPGDMPMAEAHRISSRLESRLRQKISGLERVVVHTEPRSG
jgi:cation diffusion facilitator family transporter